MGSSFTNEHPHGKNRRSRGVVIYLQRRIKGDPHEAIARNSDGQKSTFSGSHRLMGSGRMQRDQFRIGAESESTGRTRTPRRGLDRKKTQMVDGRWSKARYG
jgi:hypothetical protein